MILLQQFSVSVTLLFAIALGAVLVYAPFGVVGFARLKLGYDYAAPRAMFDKLPPYAQRAAWAHQNAFESFTVFAPAALMAYATGVTSPLASGAAIAYVIARTLYPVFYIANVPIGRSAMFAVGSLSSFTLIGLSLSQAIGT
jgi:uncharacterized MAPEG superfamily protein